MDLVGWNNSLCSEKPGPADRLIGGREIDRTRRGPGWRGWRCGADERRVLPGSKEVLHWCHGHSTGNVGTQWSAFPGRWDHSPSSTCGTPAGSRWGSDNAGSHGFFTGSCPLPGLSILGALGGRPDHMVNNMGIIARFCRRLPLVMVDEDSLTTAVWGQESLEAEVGEIWSFWSFEENLPVTLKGLRWPVENSGVGAGVSPSISNVATGSVVEISSPDGPVLVHRRFRTGRFPVSAAH